MEDKYQTPLDVAFYMASLIEEHSIIFEPTPGIGNLVKALESSGHLVECPNGNYFDDRDRFLNNDYDCDCVVMNPPFSSKSAILDNAPQKFIGATGMSFGYEMLNEMMLFSPRVIALMPWYTISDSDVRLRKLKRYGLKSVTLLPRKTFDYARIQTCVLDLEKGYKGDTKFLVYDTLNDDKIIKMDL